MKLLTFDVGGTEVKHAIIEDALTISDQGTVPTPKDSFDSFTGLIQAIYQSYQKEVDGIVISLPGPVDAQNGCCESCSIMRYPHSKEIAKIVGEICGCPVSLENDGKAAALAEYRYGSLRGCRNAAVFVIGTGVGGGLIINGEIVRGINHSAGEFSFINTEPAQYTNPDQIMGNRCSTTYLLKRYHELKGDMENIDGRELFRRLPQDEDARIALDDLCRNIAIQLYNLYWLLDLEKTAIGGGISRQPLLIEKIKEQFIEVQNNALTARYAMKVPMEIVPCRFSNDANLIGAYLNYEKLYG